MKRHIRLLRFRIGRFIIHSGMSILPRGRVRSDLYQLIDEWATRVYKVIENNNDR